jgi:hypothetical protein
MSRDSHRVHISAPKGGLASACPRARPESAHTVITDHVKAAGHRGEEGRETGPPRPPMRPRKGRLEGAAPAVRRGRRDGSSGGRRGQLPRSPAAAPAVRGGRRESRSGGPARTPRQQLRRSGADAETTAPAVRGGGRDGSSAAHAGRRLPGLMGHSTAEVVFPTLRLRLAPSGAGDTGGGESRDGPRPSHALGVSG